jgi:hypothetical protein
MPVPSQNSPYFLIDLDRCLVDTDRLHALLENIVARETPVTAQQLEQAHIDAGQSGGSFDTAGFVRAKLRQLDCLGDWDHVADIFVRTAQSMDMSEPGARELLGALDDAHLSYGILTYGGEMWQLLKLKASRFDHIPYLITDIKEKGGLIASWKQPGGSFLLPGALASDGQASVVPSFVLLDDKASNFTGMPDGVKGMHILPWDGSELLAAQQGVLPQGVITAKGMNGALALINSQYIA